MINWILGLYYKRLRRLDREILWPHIKDQSKSFEEALWAFAMHTAKDPAWLFLSKDEVDEEIDKLR